MKDQCTRENNCQFHQSKLPLQFWPAGHDCHGHKRKVPCEKSTRKKTRKHYQAQITGFIDSVFTKFKIFRKEISHHSSKHATKAPHVQRIIIILQINQQFRAFKVSERINLNSLIDKKKKDLYPNGCRKTKRHSW